MCVSARANMVTTDIFRCEGCPNAAPAYSTGARFSCESDDAVPPPADAGWPMSSSDLEHFPFDARPGPPDEGTRQAPEAVPNDAGPPSSREARIFRDASGVTWWVHEVAGEHLGTAGAQCLLVVSANELRRVWKYPPDWRSLPWDALLALVPSGRGAASSPGR